MAIIVAGKVNSVVLVLLTRGDVAHIILARTDFSDRLNIPFYFHWLTLTNIKREI